MLGSILKGAAYAKAPRATFAVLHPRQAFELAKLPYDLRHAYAPRLVAGAALVLAFPAGVLVGRALERRRRRSSRRASDATIVRAADAERAAYTGGPARRPGRPSVVRQRPATTPRRSERRPELVSRRTTG